MQIDVVKYIIKYIFPWVMVNSVLAAKNVHFYTE